MRGRFSYFSYKSVAKAVLYGAEEWGAGRSGCLYENLTISLLLTDS
jgi:hypothetical protein